MTGTEMTYELYSGLSDFIPNHVLSEVLYEALEEVGDQSLMRPILPWRKGSLQKRPQPMSWRPKRRR